MWLRKLPCHEACLGDAGRYDYPSATSVRTVGVVEGPAGDRGPGSSPSSASSSLYTGQDLPLCACVLPSGRVVWKIPVVPSATRSLTPRPDQPWEGLRSVRSHPPPAALASSSQRSRRNPLGYLPHNKKASEL